MRGSETYVKIFKKIFPQTLTETRRATQTLLRLLLMLQFGSWVMSALMGQHYNKWLLSYNMTETLLRLLKYFSFFLLKVKLWTIEPFPNFSEVGFEPTPTEVDCDLNAAP